MDEGFFKLPAESISSAILVKSTPPLEPTLVLLAGGVSVLDGAGNCKYND